MVNVSRDICIKCEACSAVCPTRIIQIGNDGYPLISETACIRCGQCEAVCPSSAIYNDILPQDNILPLEKYPPFSSHDSELFLRARRSIRHWDNTATISEDEIRKLVNVGRYAPTGSNTQQVSYIVISSSDKMDKIRKMTLDFYEKGESPRQKLVYQQVLNTREPGYDVLFRGAPMLIVACGDKKITNNPSYVSSAQFALTYVELFAPSLGLGTCYAGYFNSYLNSGCPKLLEALGTRENQTPIAALLFGRPKFRYYRTTSRNPLDATVL